MEAFLAHALKYLIVSCLLWLACYLSSIHLTWVSAGILGFIGGLLEWKCKIWFVRQLTTVHDGSTANFKVIQKEIRSVHNSIKTDL